MEAIGPIWNIVSPKRKEATLVTPEHLENVPIFDETEEMERMPERNGILIIREPAKK
jgi:hypothetical protein